MKAYLIRLFKYFPIGALLFPLFISFHGANYAFDWIKIQDLLFFLFNCYLAITILFVFVWFTLNQFYNAAILTFTIVAAFFCFGFVQDIMSYIALVLGKPRYVAICILLILLLVYNRIKKASLIRKIKFNFVNNIVFTSVTLVELLFVLIHSLTTHPNKITFYNTDINSASITKSDAASKPDIYFLVFDEYASSKALKQNFNYDNIELDSFLLDQGFFTAANAKSNYAVTAFSIASTFNMNYFKDWENIRYPSDFPTVCSAMKDNVLFRFLRGEGYSIFNYSIFNFDNTPSLYTDIESNLGMSAMLSHALTERVDLKLLLNNLLGLKPYQQTEMINVLKQVEEDRKLNTSNPKFFYIHILLPHSPFIFNRDGSLKSVFSMTAKQDIMGADSYIDQLVYTNKIIKKFLLRIKQPGKKQVIILEGDHGFRNAQVYKGKKIPKEYYTKGEFFRNLNTFYFYDGNYSSLYDSISPVNTFRVVLNQFFDKNMPMLKDTSFHKKGTIKSALY